MTKLFAPFPWYGGKRRWADAVNARLGDVDVYVEPFAGSLAILLQRAPARREIVCDLDGMICNAWRAIRDDPDTVVVYADAPTYHHELTARRNWLARRIADGLSQALETDVDFFDARAAGYWVWCVSSWIGGISDMLATRDDRVVWDKRPLVLNSGGQGVQLQREQIPHVGASLGGQGFQVQREQIPHVDDKLAGVGVQLQRATRPDRLDWFSALSERLERVIVLNRNWRSALTDTMLVQTPSSPDVSVGIVLDPPYLTSERMESLYAAEDGDNPALDSWTWAVEHGDRYRIAYACHVGDFDPPDGWRVATMSMVAGNRNREEKKADCFLFSPACLRPTEQMALL